MNSLRERLQLLLNATNPCKADQERQQRAYKSRVAAREIYDGLARRIEFMPGYDHSKFPVACGGGGHGVHGLDMTWCIIGKPGAVTWRVWFSQMIPGNFKGFGSVPTLHPQLDQAMAVDLGYHSRVLRYEDQDTMECDLVPEGRCYYEGSGLSAGPLLELLMWEGPAPVWDALTEYYHDTFSD